MQSGTLPITPTAGAQAAPHVQNGTDSRQGLRYSGSMETSSRVCYRIDARQVRGVEDPVRAVELTTRRERQNELALEAHTIIHEHRRLTAEETGRYHAVLDELHDVETAIATLGREAGASGAGLGTREGDGEC